MDDQDFLDRFEATSISREDWSHRSHLRMAYLYLRTLDDGTALSRMREGIRRLNAANRVPENLHSGYHETLTVAWARLVAESIRRTPPVASFDEFLAANAQLLEKTLVLRYYSAPLLFSADARRSWVEPDLGQLPGEIGESRNRS
jgi:hypothetical protein